MTLEETIKHAEEVAEEQEELYRLCPASESEIYCDGTKDCKTLKNGKNKGCQKCAKEHRQLAEWLKDYERLLEQKPKTGHWISLNTGKPSYIEYGMTIDSVKCSECGEWLTASDEYACYGRFCPNCGAKMIESQESEE